MSRIDWKVSVTPIASIAASGEALSAETLSADVKGTLGGGNSSGTWAGSDIADWAAGVHTAKSSDGGTIVSSASDGIWIKHTGFDAADGTTINTANVTVSVAGPIVIATLGPGEGLFLPSPGDTTFTLGDNGTPAAVQYGIFT